MKRDLEGVKIPGFPLLPHERWLAEWGITQQRKNRTEQVIRIQQNYGPAGVALLFAAAAWILPGGALVVLATILAVATRAGTVFYWVGAIAVLIVLPGLPRALQSLAAGRRFRGGRPFER